MACASVDSAGRVHLAQPRIESVDQGHLPEKAAQVRPEAEEAISLASAESEYHACPSYSPLEADVVTALTVFCVGNLLWTNKRSLQVREVLYNISGPEEQLLVKAVFVKRQEGDGSKG